MTAGPRRVRPGLALLLSLAIFLGPALGSAAGRPSSSGLRGLVKRGPTSPVCVPGLPCSRPAAGITLTFSRHGKDAARARTAQDGSFRIVLVPGSYGVRATGASPARPIQPATVTVEAGRFKRVAFFIDTGIR